MELRHLQTFMKVAELRHFARAAEACHLSQPAVSHQISQLEEEVGARLFNRTAHGVTITVAGEALVEEARRILANVDRARQRLHEITSGAIGRVRLGASPTPGLYLLPPILARYRRDHPAYDLVFELGRIPAIADRVAANDLDMAIIAGRPPKGELRATPVLRDEVVVVVPPSDPLGAARAVTPRQLAGVTLIHADEDAEMAHRVGVWMQRERVAAPRTLATDGPDAVKRAVAAGLGVGLVSRLGVVEELSAKRLAQVRLKVALPARYIHVIDHPHKHHGAACRAMLDMVRGSFPESDR